MDIYLELSRLQGKMEVKKDQSGFKGRYKYRDLETILKVFNTHKSDGTYLRYEFSIIGVGSEIFTHVRAFIGNETGEIYSDGFCQVGDGNQGTSKEQVSGSAQTYATRYALQTMFLLGGDIDPDSQEYQEQKQQTKKPTTQDFINLKIFCEQILETIKINEIPTTEAWLQCETYLKKVNPKWNLKEEDRTSKRLENLIKFCENELGGNNGN